MSTHECPIVEIKLNEHPDADMLSLVKVGGYECVVKTDEWKDGDIGIYIPPDYVVPNNDIFAFLGGNTRIKVRKYRGKYSQGLLIPVPPEFFNATVGESAMDALGIVRYEPPVPMSSYGQDTKGPSGHFSKYDVENIELYSDLIAQGDHVIITEKIHGTNARFVNTKGSDSDDLKMFCGSRTRWKQEGSNWWSLALQQNPWIESWCKDHPGLCLYGEVYGNVQELKYGAAGNHLFFKVFDIWHVQEARWLTHKEVATCADSRVEFVPVVYHGPFDLTKARELAEGNSTVITIRDKQTFTSKHIREGVVIRPVPEKYDRQLGRIQLKLVSNRYLSKTK